MVGRGRSGKMRKHIYGEYLNSQTQLGQCKHPSTPCVDPNPRSPTTDAPRATAPGANACTAHSPTYATATMRDIATACTPRQRPTVSPHTRCGPASVAHHYDQGGPRRPQAVMHGRCNRRSHAAGSSRGEIVSTRPYGRSNSNCAVQHACRLRSSALLGRRRMCKPRRPVMMIMMNLLIFGRL